MYEKKTNKIFEKKVDAPQSEIDKKIKVSMLLFPPQKPHVHFKSEAIVEIKCIAQLI